MPKLLPRSDLDDTFDMFPGVQRYKPGRITVRGTDIKPSDVMGTLMRMAADVVKRQNPEWTRNARQLAIANGWFESYLGGAGSFAPDGKPTWNWGAVMARKGMPFFNHGDHKADGTPFTGGFAVFPTMTDGFLFWRKIMPTQALKTMQAGDAYGQARAMFIAGYYDNVDSEPIGVPRGSTEGDARRIQGYANALVRTAKLVAKALGEPDNLVSGAAGSHGYLAPVGNELASVPNLGQDGSSATPPPAGSVAPAVVTAGVVTGAVLAGQAIFGKTKA